MFSAKGSNLHITIKQTTSKLIPYRFIFSAVAVCCTHGRRSCLRAAVRGGARGAGGGAVLSLEEVLAEGAPPAAGRPPPFTKQQQRALQDAMYYAAETDHLGMIYFKFHDFSHNTLYLDIIKSNVII